MPLEALLFDVDGTLAETEEAHRQSFNEAFAAFGVDWSWDKELYRELLQVTGGKERLHHYIDAWKPRGSEVVLARFDEIYEGKSARYAALVKAGVARARPGVRRLITAMFGEEGPSWFAAIAAGDAVAHKKPAPDVYRFALDTLGCDPGTCVAIEDSKNGIKAARAAGLPVLAVPSNYLKGDDFSLATSVLSDLGEPDRPCRQIGGLRFDRDYVDIDGLNAWLSKQQQSRARPPRDPAQIVNRSVETG
jgi:beta-phosphoglucomutase-like phosphatase (HAD superfamily)